METIMKVGPKGQVVIPHEFRNALHIYPGSNVLFKLKDQKLEIEKPPVDAVAVFRETAKGMGQLELRPHEAYEDELDNIKRLHRENRTPCTSYLFLISCNICCFYAILT